ncbi:hypothetical protein L6164_026029 [Bauhinia variegata]|uniref:Uncharacterized protein n=1 Tax=Bauhinia variegata TaxID=167791 RepID=A0ACB9M5L8_BAUVA|nr:hypothetical protein L6164_026029 [Bauhinia variegata]
MLMQIKQQARTRCSCGCNSSILEQSSEANACGYAIAMMPSAKGLVPEHHPHFIGTYCGNSILCEIVESADAYLLIGPIFNDYSSVGYSLLLKKEKAIIVQLIVANGPVFGCILMKDFLQSLSKRLNKTKRLMRITRESRSLMGCLSNVSLKSLQG